MSTALLVDEVSEAPSFQDDDFQPVRTGVTVLVPAYNEAESVADTIKSLQNQTIPPAEIIEIGRAHV